MLVRCAYGAYGGDCIAVQFFRREDGLSNIEQGVPKDERKTAAEL